VTVFMSLNFQRLRLEITQTKPLFRDFPSSFFPGNTATATNTKTWLWAEVWACSVWTGYC